MKHNGSKSGFFKISNFMGQLFQRCYLIGGPRKWKGLNITNILRVPNLQINRQKRGPFVFSRNIVSGGTLTRALSKGDTFLGH